MNGPAPSVFRSSSFRLFFAGQALSYIGDGLRTIAIPLLVFHLTNSAAALGLTYALEYLPFALFGLVGGSLADRIDRRRLMIACDFVRFTILGVWALAYAAGLLTLWMIYGGIVIISICASVFMGSQASSIPFLIGKDRATAAVSVLLATEQTAVLVTPPFGGAIFSIFGALPALIINAVTYISSQLSIAAVETFGPTKQVGLPSAAAVAGDVAVGFRFLRDDAAMFEMTVLGLFFNAFGMMTAAVLIPFWKRDFGASDLLVGYALGAGALGAVLGSVISARIPRSWPLGTVLNVAFILDTFLFLPVMVTHDLRVAVFFFALTNAAATLEVAQIVGWRMRVIPEHLVGRVFGVIRLVVLIGAAPGAIVGGMLADHFDARLPIVVSGIGYLGCAIVFWCMPAIRKESR